MKIGQVKYDDNGTRFMRDAGKTLFRVDVLIRVFAIALMGGSVIHFVLGFLPYWVSVAAVVGLGLGVASLVLRIVERSYQIPQLTDKQLQQLIKQTVREELASFEREIRSEMKQLENTIASLQPVNLDLAVERSLVTILTSISDGSCKNEELVLAWKAAVKSVDTDSPDGRAPVGHA